MSVLITVASGSAETHVITDTLPTSVPATTITQQSSKLFLKCFFMPESVIFYLNLAINVQYYFALS